MKSTFETDNVMIVFTDEEYAQLLIYLGMLVGSMGYESDFFPNLIKFVNKMNEGNPKWIAYQEKKNEKTI